MYLLNLCWCWIAPQVLSSPLFYFGTYLPHRGQFEVNTFPARSNDYPHWLSMLTCFHFGYHAEHHQYPYVPWYLPTIRVLEEIMNILLLLPIVPLLILCANLLTWHRPHGIQKEFHSGISIDSSTK